MSTLERVNPRWRPLSKVPSDSPNSKVTGWRPGDACCEWLDPKGYGLVVSIFNEENLLVLWSQEPSLVPLDPATLDRAMAPRGTLLDVLGIA